MPQTIILNIQNVHMNYSNTIISIPEKKSKTIKCCYFFYEMGQIKYKNLLLNAKKI